MCSHAILSLFLLASICSGSLSRHRRQAPQDELWWLNADIDGVEIDPTENIVNPQPPLGNPNLPQPPVGPPTNPQPPIGLPTNPSQPISSSRNLECDGPGTLCVPYFQCKDGQVITDGSNIIDIRFGDNNGTVRGHTNCQGALDLCCRVTGHNNVLPTQRPPSSYNPTCGRRNPDGISASLRIANLNATQARVGEFPWMTAILRQETVGGKEVNLYVCGGSLIRDNLVLTAAHCVAEYGARHLRVRLGEWDTQSTAEEFPHQDRKVADVFIHPDFNSKSLFSDVAILVLSPSATLAPNVDTICLPNRNDIFDYSTCIATGWGKHSFGEAGQYQNVLKQVELGVVPNVDCQNRLRTTRLGEYFILDGTFMCAGGEVGKDTCTGDGGSPLVCARPSGRGKEPVYVQAGIVAWGIGCGEKGIPGVYANMPQLVDWVDDVVTSVSP